MSPEPGLVLLHGFTGSPASWDPIVARLPSSARILRPALLGHCGAPAPDVSGFDHEVDRLAALVRAEGLVDSRLVGYSLGARVGLGLLLRHPALFTSAVLVGLHPGLPDPQARRRRRAEDEALACLLESAGLPAFVSAWEALPLFDTQRRLPEPLCARRRAIRLGHDPAGLARALRTLGLGAMPDRHPALGDLSVPAIFVAGAEDGKFRDVAEDLVSRVSSARLLVVPGAGHDVVLERPDAVASLLAGGGDSP